MNFQDFCNSVQHEDKQNIEFKSSDVLIYTNESNESFTIFSEDVFSFIYFLNENHDLIYKSWSSVELLKKKPFTCYEEKSYRAIYNCISKDNNLRVFKTAGGSQTKALTKVITKVICFLLGLEYIGVDKNSFFDKNSIQQVIKKFPTPPVISEFDNADVNYVNNKKNFIQWLRNAGYAESSIKKYSCESIPAANKIVRSIIPIFKGFYSINSKVEFEGNVNVLNSNAEWQSLNASGNNMYAAGIEKYKNYLSQNYNIKNVSLSKSFVILSGISGTGKTRFVREQAKHYNATNENYCLVSVRPDWHEPSDLLGYISYMSGSAEFIATDILRFFVAAWKHIILKITNKNGCFYWEGNPLSEIKPFFLCLDEMNLAPVEQYFSDYLSVLETQRWSNDLELKEFNEKNKLDYKYFYECDPLVKECIFGQLNEDARNKLAKNLNLDLESDYDNAIWNYFIHNGISIPFNLILAGTVNMDETTHGFSRKVIDRAITLDFGEFYPNDFSSFFEPQTKNNILTYPVLTDGRNVTKLNQTIDKEGARTVEFINRVNSVLQDSPFMLAYRALNELLLSVIAIAPKDERMLLATWDDFIMTKVLPRIEGDHDKLTGIAGDSNLLEGLKRVLKEELSTIWEGSSRPDLYRSYNVAKVPPQIFSVSYNTVSDVVWIECRSKHKLEWMLKRLQQSAFTSFWP